MSCLTVHDPQLVRLADAIAQKVGQQRFHVWFNNSTRLDLRNDGLEIAVPNDFISEWIGKNFTRPIQEAAHEVLGCTLSVRFNVVPELFDLRSDGSPDEKAMLATANHGMEQKRSAKVTPLMAAVSAGPLVDSPRRGMAMLRPPPLL